MGLQGLLGKTFSSLLSDFDKNCENLGNRPWLWKLPTAISESLSSDWCSQSRWGGFETTKFRSGFPEFFNV